MIEVGKSGTKNVYKRGPGRASKHKKFVTAINHQPEWGGTRRRCAYCATKKLQSRTLYICDTCKQPLCVLCFKPFHNNR